MLKKVVVSGKVQARMCIAAESQNFEYFMLIKSATFDIPLLNITTIIARCFFKVAALSAAEQSRNFHFEHLYRFPFGCRHPYPDKNADKGVVTYCTLH